MQKLQAVFINDVNRLARDAARLGVIRRDFEKHRSRAVSRKLPAETARVQSADQYLGRNTA